MASTNELLAATLGLQANAQANLPVIPNNGNPAGAHNMPQQEQAGAAPAAPAHPYPWMAPSPHMDNIKRRIAGIQQNLGTVAQPVQQQAPPPVAAQPGLPIIPQNVLA